MQLFAAIANDDLQADWGRLVLAVAAVCLLAWGAWLARQGQSGRHQRLRDGLLLLLGAAGALAWPNFGSLHFGNFIHTWDTYHYYLGSKYFPELGYDRLYQCTAVADFEAGLGEVVAKRKLTDLRTNALVPASEALEHPEECTRHFRPERWESFRRDVAYFRGRLNPGKWEMVQHDHGYNATPVWTLLGRALSSLGPATTTTLGFLCALDWVLLAGAAALVGWAFGPRVLAVALLTFGTSYPSRFFWTGGAFLRMDWLFYTVAAVCLLRKERAFLAGLCLGYATLLRIFPGFLLVGPLLALIEHFFRARQLDRRYLRLFGGVAVATAVLLPVSYAVEGGTETFVRFTQNTVKHANTPLTNHMGLRTALSYRPDQIGARLRDGSATDPWGRWKEARLAAFRQARPVYWMLVAASVVLLFFAVRRASAPWVTCAASATMIAVGAELTCYYYAFLFVVAVLHAERREAGLLVVTLAAVTAFIGLAPLPNMSGWDDEKYVAMSFASLIAFAGVLWELGKGAEHALPKEPPWGWRLSKAPAQDLRGKAKAGRAARGGAGRAAGRPRG